MIIPFPNKVFIRPDKTDLGAFEQIDSRVSESGVITHIHGRYIPCVACAKESCQFSLCVGDKVQFKAWGMDSIEIEGVKYFVADLDRKNLLCKIQPATE